MADSSRKINDSLTNIPENISITYLPDHETLSEKARKRVLNNYTQGYIHGIKIGDGETEKVHVTGRCWPSMRKNQPPHTLFIKIDKPNDSITDGHCSCKAG